MHPPPTSPGFASSPASSSASLDELTEIDTSLKQLDLDARRLEKKLFLVRDRAQRLRERRRLLEPTAPWIHRLPSEILAQILLKGTQPSYPHAHSSPQAVRRDRVKLPIAVSKVCRQWRSVALQLPSMWSYIDMREGRPYDRTLVWLKRSRTAILDIDLDYRDQLDKPEAYFQRNFLITLNVILPTMNRWGSLAVHAPTELVQTALHVFTSPAPMLHTLILKGWQEEGPGAQTAIKDMPPTIFCSQTPRLKTVYLREVGLRWDTCIFSAMRELTLVRIPKEHIPNVHQFARMVEAAAPSLQRLTVVGSGPKPVHANNSPRRHHTATAPPAPTQVILSRLAEMRLEEFDGREIKTLVNLLVTPGLRRLTLARISDDAMDHDQDTNTEPDWRPQALSYLSDLTLSSVPLWTGLFQMVCRAAPNILRLHVNGGGDITNSVLSYLTPNMLLLLPDEEQLYLPRLAVLEMDEASADTVRSFIDSRTGPGGTLREVKGSILNEMRIKSKGVLRGEEAVRHLGWNKNANIQVAIQPSGPIGQ